MVHFRKATYSDLPSIVGLLADDELGSAREAAGLPLAASYLTAFSAIDSDPNQYLAVGEVDGVIVSTFQVTVIPTLARLGAQRGQIEGVRVARSHRGRGIGEASFVWAVEYCQRRGCEIVQLTSDNSRRNAHLFYEKLGFVKSHAGFKRSIAPKS